MANALGMYVHATPIGDTRVTMLDVQVPNRQAAGDSRLEHHSDARGRRGVQSAKQVSRLRVRKSRPASRFVWRQYRGGHGREFPWSVDGYVAAVFVYWQDPANS